VNIHTVELDEMAKAKKVPVTVEDAFRPDMADWPANNSALLVLAKMEARQRLQRMLVSSAFVTAVGVGVDLGGFAPSWFVGLIWGVLILSLWFTGFWAARAAATKRRLLPLSGSDGVQFETRIQKAPEIADFVAKVKAVRELRYGDLQVAYEIGLDDAGSWRMLTDIAGENREANERAALDRLGSVKRTP
jgi:hypothetical protein